MTSSRAAAEAPAPTADANRAPPRIAFEQIDFAKIAQHMYALMLRNVASDGFPFRDLYGNFSKPGCVIAAPSYPANNHDVDQDYVYNWVRDAAITVVEIAAAEAGDGGDTEPLVDYVTFAKLCQDTARPTLGHAAFKVDGTPRCWTEQNDGPAIQTLAILTFFERLDAQTRATALAVMQKNVDYIATVYREPTRNLWEEKDGLSFFARAVQLACLRAVMASKVGLDVPQATGEAIAWLEAALAAHWNGAIYMTMLATPAPGEASRPAVGPNDGYDPNVDIVCAAIYGAVPVTDPKLLATAAALRAQWADRGAACYPINSADKAIGLGPLLGRYPGDVYDGDVAMPVRGGHPWALCTANFAELYYRLANAIARDTHVPLDEQSSPFFAQIGVVAGASADAAITALREAGDAMLRAIVYHSDHLELSEQFDGTSGYEKSVRNLTWSYAAFLSAVRARTGGII